MELNRKILKIGLIIIILSLVFSIGFAFAFKLDNPVFLKQYTENPLFVSEGFYENGEFTLRYITNISDKREVTDIYSDEYPQLQFYASESGFGGNVFFMFNGSHYARREVYGRYLLRTVYVRIDVRGLEEGFDEIELNNVRINFSNGDILEADLGRIMFYNQSNYNNGDFETRISGSSSDGTSSTTMRLKRNVTILNIESPLLSNVHDLVELWIDGVEYKNISEIQYKEGSDIKIFSSFKHPKDILRKYDYYNLHPKINYRDSDGNLFTKRFYNVDYRNHKFNLKDIVKYLRARGEI